MCQLNKEPIAYPNKFVGDRCPLQEVNYNIKGENNNETN
jgi:hypothetical protein